MPDLYITKLLKDMLLKQIHIAPFTEAVFGYQKQAGKNSADLVQAKLILSDFFNFFSSPKEVLESYAKPVHLKKSAELLMAVFVFHKERECVFELLSVLEKLERIR